VLCRRDTAQQQALQGSRVALHRSSAAYHNPLPNQSARGFSLLQQARQPSTKIALVDGPRTWAVLGCEPIHESTLPQVAVVSLQFLLIFQVFFSCCNYWALTEHGPYYSFGTLAVYLISLFLFGPCLDFSGWAAEASLLTSRSLHISQHSASLRRRWL
jgi:hypothetical protein